MMRTKTRIWTAITIVFLSGIVIGFYAGQMYLHWRVDRIIRQGPAALQEYMLRRMALYLHPSADQAKAMSSVLGQAAQQVNERREKGMTEQWSLMKQELQRMQPPLTPEQQQVLDRMKLADLLPGRRARMQRTPDGVQP
jgi:hypothetical protein